MNIQIISNGHEKQAELLQRTIAGRIGAKFGEGGLTLELAQDASIGAAESYCIARTLTGWKVTGADGAGLYYGIGRLLHTARWSETEFAPQPPAGVVTPACDFRAMYFAVHFYNWYQQATTEEMEDYVEQMLLWGYNTIICILPVVNCESFDEELMKKSADKVRSIFRLCRKLGMRTGIIIGANQGLKSAPHELDADLSYNQYHRGHAGRNLCLSKPDAVEYMRSVIYRGELQEFTETGLDYVISWPYDEGGCGCAGCKPWGGNKYLDGAKYMREETLKLYPNAQFILSTWDFDVEYDEGEYAGLYRRMTGDMSWLNYIMVDNQYEYPRYPLEHEVIKPAVNFPEISMWALYPWGGFGANPLPKRFQRIWDESRRILKGGMPYSEGKYEDISKVQCVGYYWDPDRSYRDILSEYIGYEYAPDVCDEVLEIMELIEQNHVGVFEEKEPDLAAAARARELAEAVNAKLPEAKRTAWRWRILYLRTLLDEKRYSYYEAHKQEQSVFLRLLVRHSGDMLVKDEEAQAMFKELCECYKCVDYNGENQWTHPPVNGGYEKDTRI